MDELFLMRIINSIFALSIFVLNLYYFIINKTIWRWIKLAYAMNGLIFFIVWSLGIFGIYATRVQQSLMNMLLLATILGGTIVSFAKVSMEKYYYKKVSKIDLRKITEEYLLTEG